MRVRVRVCALGGCASRGGARAGERVRVLCVSVCLALGCAGVSLSAGASRVRDARAHERVGACVRARVKCVCMGACGLGWDGMGWDGMGWGGMGRHGMG